MYCSGFYYGWNVENDKTRGLQVNIWKWDFPKKKKIVRVLEHDMQLGIP